MVKLSDIYKSFLKDDEEGKYQTLNKSYLIIWVIVIFVVIFILWASFAKVDEVTRGAGKVIPSGQVQTVQNLEGGIIKEINVREGQIVKKNDILMIIDNTRFLAQVKETDLKIAARKMKLQRLNAEANQTPFQVSENLKNKYPDLAKYEEDLYQARINEYDTRLTTLNSQIQQKQQELAATESKKNTLEQQLVLVEKEYNMTKPLAKEGVVSQVELLRLEQQLNKIRGDIAEANINIPKIKAAISESKNKIEELKTSFRSDALKQLTTVKAELSGLQEMAVALKDRVSRTNVRSPVNGIIKRIKVTTVGGVVKPGMDLVEIVPLKDTLLIEAKIRPSDVAFLHPGQKVNVRFTAYDFATYGGLSGTLEHISADTIEDNQGQTFYLIRVRTDKTHLGSKKNPLLIIPGMTAEVDIITGKKTIMSYILKPIIRTQKRALGER